MDDTLFEDLVKKAVENIPSEFLKKLENVEIIAQKTPFSYQLEILKKRGDRGLLLGLYEGVPQTKRGRYGVGPTLPDKITIFKNPLISISNDIKELKENVRSTVIHEIAHHFGMSEEQIRDGLSAID